MLIQPVELSLPYKFNTKDDRFYIDEIDLMDNLARFFKATFYRSISSTVIDNSNQTEFYINDQIMNLTISLRDKWICECPGVIYLGVTQPIQEPVLGKEGHFLVNVKFYVDYESLTYLRLLDD